MSQNKTLPKGVNSAAVYLQLKENGVYTACVSSKPLSATFLKLCDEKEYPVSVYYSRLDMNGSSVLERDICNNREDLMSTLNWCGACRHTILEVWDFDLARNSNPEIVALFHASTTQKINLIIAEQERAEESSKVSLADKIESASTRIAAPHSTDEVASKVPSHER